MTELAEIEEEFTTLENGECPESELIRIFWLLNSRRPRSMDVGYIGLADMQIAHEHLTWLCPPFCLFVDWIMLLDNIWMNDYHRREKARRDQAKAKR